MSDAIPYKQIIDRVKSDIDWIAEQAHAKGYNEAKLIYQNPNAESDYQRGLEDGKARNENGCVGCRYDNGRIDHSPCDYCCNAYSNQWMAKEKADEIDEIKVSDIITDGKINYLVIDITDKSYVALQGTDFEPVYIGKDYIKSYHNLHDPKDMRKIAEEISKATKGERRNCSTCKYIHNMLMCNTCYEFNKWEPKEGAE